MAKLEFYRQQVTPRISTPDVRGLAAIPNQGAQIAEGVSKLAQLGGKIQEGQRALKLTQLNAQSLKALQDFELSLETDTDYDNYESKYNNVLADIEKGVSEAAGGDNTLLRAWKSEFAPRAMEKQFNIRKSALRGKINVARADLDQTIDTYSGLVGGDDPDKDADIASQAQLSIQTALDAGIISPQEALTKMQKFNSSAITSRVNRDILNNPIAARDRLIKNGYPGMDEPTKTKLLDRATTEATQYLTRINTEEERAERRARRAKEDLQDNLRTAGDQFIINNDLDGLDAWFRANQTRLDPADRTRFLKTIRRQDIVTDFTTFANLSERAASGQNVEPEARQAVAQGLLSDDDYRVVVNASRETGWRKRGFAFIDNNLKPSQLEKTNSLASIRSANALRDWNNWVRDNPNATDAQADAESKRIVDEYSAQGRIQSVAVLRRPTYLVSTGPNSFDLKQTFAKTKKAFDAGQINKDEYERQSALIKQWMAVYKPPPPPKPKP
jgi:hypothetical protein